ncbi:hypothetical protein WR25_10793 isoform B [Diploscapter pachys]|nr:hypothetical protein WR25_10793 isoform B [Diploscapter pachys]
MNLNYQRTDFAQVSTTNRGCMRIVPGDLKKGQLDRIAVGGQNGCVVCLVRKNNDTQILFKTQPGPPIEALCLGGALGTIQDKQFWIFVASDTNVRAINKKGKIFFSFDTNMAEPARKMFVYGVDLVLAGQKSYNHYHDCADSNYILSSEDICDVISLEQDSAWGSRPFTSILACRDATLKVVEGSTIAYELELKEVPLALHLFNGDGGYMKNLVIYGTKGGRLGMAQVPEKQGQIVWEINTTTASEVTTITTYNLFGGQMKDILVGKEDGLIEIYSPEDNEQVTLKGTYQCDESITSLSCGRVTNENDDEIIVCTYTGWIFSLNQSNNASSTTAAPQASSGVNVKAKVSEERKRYEEMTKKDGGKLAFVPHFQVHDHFELNPEYGAYTLVIELVIPIDFVLVQSKLPIHLMEVEKNASVVCQIPKSDTNPWPLLASYRCQANTSRLELRVRVDEGQHGNLIVYVCPKIHPKMVQVQSYQVRPLSAHIRVHGIDISRPMSTLSFTGSFTISEAHAWLAQLVPGVPAKCPPSDTITNYFQCSINGGTQLQVTYT